MVSTSSNSPPDPGTSLCIPVPSRILGCINSENNNCANTEVNTSLNTEYTEVMANKKEKFIYFEDADALDLQHIVKWPLDISDKHIDLIIVNVPENFGKIENLKSTYADKEKVYTRTFQESNFYTTKLTESKRNVNGCYFQKLVSRYIVLFVNFFDVMIENIFLKQEHVRSTCFYNKRRGSTELCKQLVSEENYWRNVLKRVVGTVKLLGLLGLAFRGSNETVESENTGHILT